MDLEGLPLFASLTPSATPPAACPPPAPSRQPKAKPAHASAPRATTPVRSVQTAEDRPIAQVVPFPFCRDVRLVADLAAAFIKLRTRYGRRSRSILLEQRFKPLRARMRRLKVPADVIRQEMACLETAVAGAVWEADGCPSLNTGDGGAA